RTGAVVLAWSVTARAIWAIPEDTNEAKRADLTQLAKLLGMPLIDIQLQLSNEEKNYVYINRQVYDELAKHIKSRKIPGIHQQDEMRRSYPDGGMMAHVLGFTNIEDKGIEGVELAFNSELSGRPGSRRVIKDRLGRVVEDVQAVVPPVNGQDLILSIDAGLQFDTFTALKKALEEHKAKAGAGIVIDVRTGEILALVNLPTYDPNDRDDRKGP